MISRIPGPKKNDIPAKELPETFSAISVEIERMFTELHTLESYFNHFSQQSLAAVVLAVEHQLKELLRAVGQTARNESREELRAKYGKELELARTEKASIERRLEFATKQFDEQKQVLVMKLSEAEQALDTVQADARQVASSKKELESRFQQLEADRSRLSINRSQEDSRKIAAQKEGIFTKLQQIAMKLSSMLQQIAVKLFSKEKSSGELQKRVRQLAAEKINLETRLQQAESKRIAAEQSAARLQADTHQAQSGRKELETQLKEVRMSHSEIEEAVRKLQIELKATQKEKKELEARLDRTNVQVKDMEQSSIELPPKLALEQSRNRELEIRLARADGLVAESEQSLAQLRAHFQRSQFELGESESKLTEALAAREKAETRLEEAAAKLSETERAMERISTYSKQLQIENQQLQKKHDENPANGSDFQTRLREAEDRVKRAEQTMSSWRAEAIRTGAVLKEMTASRAELRAKLIEIQTVRSEVVSLLKVQNAKSALEQQMRKIPTKSETVKHQPAVPSAKGAFPGAPSKGISTGAVVSSVRLDAAVVRLEVMLAQVARLIDDPAASLSTTPPKNAENAKLE